ncbi:uncharacterized protein LOC129599224 [Paramacrobiotus metropolitanus]|uniref:uncharacterized protein LOC129599224 n=1 Tax=Paramacrobiotus metropolitanus TaxID=2943436 RepID=UPI0024460354|nr:uncharacterized protein LOC129599224 [Paramacrobiotus metropolitanus]
MFYRQRWVTAGVLLATVSSLFWLVGGQSDLTMESTGKYAIESAIGRLSRARIFNDDHEFMRRVAWIETRDGGDPKTFRTGYYGGIWQVDADVFFNTQTDPVAISVWQPRIASKLNISWPDVLWKDLRKPFYSLLAARLQLQIQTQPGECKRPIPNSLPDQATFYLRCYHTSSSNQISLSMQMGAVRNPNSFILAITECRKAMSCTSGGPT